MDGNDSFEPGAAKHGNFITYYKFHSAKERNDLLPFEIILKNCQKSVCFLDIGCNTGDLTEEIFNEISKTCKCEALGIDLDETLILRALEKKNVNIDYECANVADSDFKALLANYLDRKGIKKFDVIFLFSVTMWIHLNYGDEGLKCLLSLVSEFADILVIEPQPWKCYKSASRRLKRANKEPFEFFHLIKMRENVEKEIENFLRQKCFFEKIYESPKTSWKRNIIVFEKIL